jgi:enoyl-CoA hydratase/carnithine racemase
MSQDLLSHAEGRIHRLTLNRPERRNALTPALARELADELDRL